MQNPVHLNNCWGLGVGVLVSLPCALLTVFGGVTSLLLLLGKLGEVLGWGSGAWGTSWPPCDFFLALAF